MVKLKERFPKGPFLTDGTRLNVYQTCFSMAGIYEVFEQFDPNVLKMNQLLFGCFSQRCPSKIAKFTDKEQLQVEFNKKPAIVVKSVDDLNELFAGTDIFEAVKNLWVLLNEAEDVHGKLLYISFFQRNYKFAGSFEEVKHAVGVVFALILSLTSTGRLSSSEMYRSHFEYFGIRPVASDIHIHPTGGFDVAMARFPVYVRELYLLTNHGDCLDFFAESMHLVLECLATERYHLENFHVLSMDGTATGTAVLGLRKPRDRDELKVVPDDDPTPASRPPCPSLQQLGLSLAQRLSIAWHDYPERSGADVENEEDFSGDDRRINDGHDDEENAAADPLSSDYLEHSGADVEETRPKSDHVRFSHPGDYDYDGSPPQALTPRPKKRVTTLYSQFDCEAQSTPAETSFIPNLFLNEQNPGNEKEGERTPEKQLSLSADRTIPERLPSSKSKDTDNYKSPSKVTTVRPMKRSSSPFVQPDEETQPTPAKVSKREANSEHYFYGNHPVEMPKLIGLKKDESTDEEDKQLKQPSPEVPTPENPLSSSYNETTPTPAETAPARFFRVLDFKSTAEGGLIVGFRRGCMPGKLVEFKRLLLIPSSERIEKEAEFANLGCTKEEVADAQHFVFNRETFDQKFKEFCDDADVPPADVQSFKMFVFYCVFHNFEE